MENWQNIDPISLRALYLMLCSQNGAVLSTATGFVTIFDHTPFLVTNLHVVSGHDTETGKQLSKIQCPDKVSILHHVTEKMRKGHGVWTVRDESLVDEETRPIWREHPRKDLREFFYPETWDERVVDIAAVRLTETDDMIELYPIEFDTAPVDVMVRPGLPVSIVGFPLGKAVGGYFPIWKTGCVASDFDESISERFFFVDASTRSGMSGSPVVFRPIGPYLDRSGQLQVGDGSISFFMGIYSGRIHEESDIGIVWRPKIISEVLENSAVPKSSR